MKITRRPFLLAAACLSLGVSQPLLAAGVSDTEIVLGTHIDLSGPAAPGMPMLRNATQMRIDEVNAAGGVHGRKIRLVVEDNGSQPQQGVRAVQKLIKSDNVFALINTFGSGPQCCHGQNGQRCRRPGVCALGSFVHHPESIRQQPPAVHYRPELRHHHGRGFGLGH